MNLIFLLGAAALAVAPAHAQLTPSYARAMAAEVCRYEEAGMSGTAAVRLAIDVLWPVYSDAILRDGSAMAARYIVAERVILCGSGK